MGLYSTAPGIPNRAFRALQDVEIVVKTFWFKTIFHQECHCVGGFAINPDQDMSKTWIYDKR